MSTSKTLKMKNLVQSNGLLHLNSARSSSSTIGLVGEYGDGTNYAGLFRDNAAGAWNLFDSLSISAAPLSTDAVSTGYTLSALNVGTLAATSVQTTNLTSGADIHIGGGGKVKLANAYVDVAPTDVLGVANKLYVDSLVQSAVQGWVAKASVVARTIYDIASMPSAAAPYSSGSGVGKSLTMCAHTAAITTLFDGVLPVIGDRVLVALQANAADNGIYTVSQIGDQSVSTTVLTRTTDANTAAELSTGAHVFIEGGTLYASTGWVLQGPFTDFAVDSSPQNWVKFSNTGMTAANIGAGASMFNSLVGSQFQFNSMFAAQAAGSAGLLTVDNTSHTNAVTFTIDQSKITGTGVLTSGSIDGNFGVINTSSLIAAASLQSYGPLNVNGHTNLNASLTVMGGITTDTLSAPIIGGCQQFMLNDGTTDAFDIKTPTAPFMRFNTAVGVSNIAFSQQVRVDAPLHVSGVSTVAEVAMTANLRLAVSEVSSCITLDATHSVVNVTCGPNPITLMLPAAANNSGRTYKLLKADAGNGPLVIYSTAGDMIDGDASGTNPVTLAKQYDYTSVTCHGAAGWFLH